MVTFLSLDQASIDAMLKKDPKEVYNTFKSFAAHLKTTDISKHPVKHRISLGMILYRDKRFTESMGAGKPAFFTKEQLDNLRREFFPAALYLDLSNEGIENYKKAKPEVLHAFLMIYASTMKSKKPSEYPDGIRLKIGKFIDSISQLLSAEQAQGIKKEFFPYAVRIDLSPEMLNVYLAADPIVLKCYFRDCLVSLKHKPGTRTLSKEQADSRHRFMNKIGYVLFKEGEPVEAVIAKLSDADQTELEDLYLKIHEKRTRAIDNLITDRTSNRIAEKHREEGKKASDLRTIGANGKIDAGVLGLATSNQ